MLRLALISITLLVFAVCHHDTAEARHPASQAYPVYPRIDVIGPLGNRLPESHRRSYNRPTYVGGKIAHLIAPTSQEAMAFERAEQRCDYACHRGRYVPQYFYPKPWEAMRVGPRDSVKASNEDDPTGDPLLSDELEIRAVSFPDYLRQSDAVR